MRFLPHTKEDIASMLDVAGAKNLETLFSKIPKNCRMTKKPRLPDPLTEWEIYDYIVNLSKELPAAHEYKMFIGAGSYHHNIPSTIPFLLSRSEFYTAYTPYQPEISQGALQAVYEYQTLTAKLLGMDIANASLYDGASALAEALLMAIRIKKKTTVAVSAAIHPNYRRVIQTYFQPSGYTIIELPYLKNGCTDISAIDKIDDLAAIAIQSPNFFGCIEDLSYIKKQSQKIESLLIASFAEPISFGLYKNPGIQGADIVCGEGQSLGIPQSFGGPGLGMFATKMDYVRRMPGRLVGKTVDMDGREGFVLTLATREQHIRREKATSNICTNSSLNALAAAMYMASLGSTGMRELSRLNYDKTEYLKQSLVNVGFKLPFDSPTFNEFVVKPPKGFHKTYNRLLKKKFIAGLPLKRFYPELAGHYMMCATETVSRDDIDALVQEVRS